LPRHSGWSSSPPAETCAMGWPRSAGTSRDWSSSIFSLPDGNGLDAAKTMLTEFSRDPDHRISSHRDPWTMLQVQRLGLHGFRRQARAEPGRADEAIHAVLAGRIYYVPMVQREHRQPAPRPEGVHPRALGLRGAHPLDESASRSPTTRSRPSSASARRRCSRPARHHAQLDVHTTPKLIHFAIVNGLTRPEQLSGRCEPVAQRGQFLGEVAPGSAVRSQSSFTAAISISRANSSALPRARTPAGPRAGARHPPRWPSRAAGATREHRASDSVRWDKIELVRERHALARREQAQRRQRSVVARLAGG